MAQVPVAEGIFTFPSDEPQLIGSKCSDCGIVTFPTQDSCPRCASISMAEHLLPRRGRLWAWTTQEFPPPSPPYSGPVGKEFVTFGVGFVELPGEVKVEARLTESDPDVLAHGMEMELVLVPFRTLGDSDGDGDGDGDGGGDGGDGDEIVTFAFRPVTESETAPRGEHA